MGGNGAVGYPGRFLAINDPFIAILTGCHLPGDGRVVELETNDDVSPNETQAQVTLRIGQDTFDDSLAVVDQNVAIARDFAPLTEEEQARLVERGRPVAGDGRHEWFKSTPFFDSGYHRQQHGFPTTLVMPN